jgi:lipid A 3-O-deacylase
MKLLGVTATMLFICFSVTAQKERDDYLQEVSITTENDNYVLTFNDGYYTNGLFLQYSRPAKWKTNNRLMKVISGYKFGQMIFVSENWINRTAQTIDRPFSGYLFFQKGYNFFYREGHVLRVAADFGATGKSSYAREIQEWYHTATGLPEVVGWPYQLNGETSLNFSAQYNYNFLGLKNQRNNFELMGTGGVNLGNAFTNVSTGLLVKFGNFEDPARSSFFNARTGKGEGEKLKRNAEVFIYFHPQIMHQLYNATVQGPLFRSDKGPIVFDINKQVYMHRWGIHYAERRWTLDVHFVKKNREAVSMREKERFGSISLAYRFGRIKQKTEPGFDSVLK